MSSSPVSSSACWASSSPPVWLTIICGIGGVLIGWFVYTAFGGDGSPGIDWVRWIIAIAVAAVLVMIASAVTARSRPRAL